MTSFQTSVATQPAPAVEGDFASANPRFVFDAGPGGLVAGPNGCTVGRFAWVQASPMDPNGAGKWANNNGAGAVTGFVHREQQALITTYLAESGMVIPAGFPVTLSTGGDFWVKNAGSGQALPGQKCYARISDGAAQFAATGSPTTGASGSASSIAAGSATVTGSINGNLLTVTATGTGIVVGALLGTAGGIAANTTIVRQVSGSVGLVGVYELSIGNQTIASQSIALTWGVLTVGGTITGAFGVGDLLSGTGGGGVAAGTVITALGTGTGGAGTYIVNLTQSVTTTTISATGNVETKWIAMSAGLPGELVKISDHALG